MRIIQPENEQEWRDLRRKGIGASDSYSIAGYGFKSPLEIFYSKTKGIETELNSSMVELGNYFEPSILKWLGDKLNCPVWHNDKKEMVWSEETPFMFCTLDGTIDTSNSDLPKKTRRLPVEVKFSQCDDYFDDTKYPDKYEIQMQHQMYCTESTIMILVACVKNKFAFWWVERNDTLISKIIALNTEFWERVQNNDPPIAENGDQDILRLIYSNIKLAKSVELSSFVKDRLMLIPELKNAIKKGNSAEQSLKSIYAIIEQEMQDAEFANINGRSIAQLKTQNRKGYIVEPKTIKQFKYLGD